MASNEFRNDFGPVPRKSVTEGWGHVLGGVRFKSPNAILVDQADNDAEVTAPASVGRWWAVLESNQ